MDVSVFAAAGMLVLGVMSGLWMGLSRRRRCPCGHVLPVSCTPGYGCQAYNRPWIADQAAWLRADTSRRGERP